LRDLKLDGMELEFVHGVRMAEENRRILMEEKENLIFTAHAPYYINLNAKEKEKVDASVERILDTARAASALGGWSIVFHAGFYLGQEKEIVFENILKQHEIISDVLKKEKNKIWVRPETTGKGTQWGDLDEVLNMCKNFDNFLPCIDFSHIHARSGGEFNTYDDFCAILEKTANVLGDRALENFHAHVAGIAYSQKGEKHHLVLDESDMNYKDLMRAFKKFNIKGVVICESPNIEVDCRILKDFYLSL
jgi:deoxyribonuclease-4